MTKNTQYLSCIIYFGIIFVAILMVLSIALNTPINQESHVLTDKYVETLIDKYVDNEYRIQTLSGENDNLVKYLHYKNEVVVFNICNALDGQSRIDMGADTVLFLGVFDIDCEIILRG